MWATTKQALLLISILAVAAGLWRGAKHTRRIQPFFRFQCYRQGRVGMSMRMRVLWVLFSCICAPLYGQIQMDSPLSEESRADSLRAIVPDVAADQKSIYWDFPRELLHGRHWVPTGLFLGATAVLIGVDQYSAPPLRRTTSFGTFNSGFSGTNTSLMIAAIPAATYAFGLMKSNSYDKKSAYLTVEAVADSEIAAEILKLATRRARPEEIRPNRNFGDTWLDASGIASGGFPSGHTITAFSVATVMSRRYGQQRKWVPYVSYGAAGLIGFSRVTLSSHNVSDVFVGAALGYAITRFIVLRRHDQIH